MSEASPGTVAELLARLDGGWAAIEAAMGQLGDGELAGRRDAAGWAVKDHLMHLAAWEAALGGRLEGRPLHEALGVDEAAVAGDEDAVNAALFARDRHRSPAEVREAVRSAHAAIRARLAALADRDLGRAVRDLLPPGAGGDGTPVGAWIAGNTWEHYVQHLDWIRTLLGRP
jgi:hypothetical protein